jgi:molybdopterin-guanine dinucleotide biosynthesis protein A
MGGRLKARVELDGRPLLQHVINRLRPQVSQIYLSVEQFNPALEVFGLDQIEDPRSGSRGPLGGLMAALQAVPEGQDWLLLLPCDAPFLPLDLGSRLHSAVLDAGTLLGVVDDAGRLQPTFSLWNRSLLPSIEQAVIGQGMGGFMQFLDGVQFSSVSWKTGGAGNKPFDLPFFNINTPDDLRQAEAVINSRPALR